MDQDTSTQDTNTEDTSQEPSWWLDESTPGPGQRPEWLPERFKRLSDVVKSYQELDKKLKTEVPDQYDFGDYEQFFDPNHQAFQNLSEFAKQNRVPQEVFSKTLEAFQQYAQDFAPNPEQIKAKLGDNADKRIELLNNWAQSNLSEQAAQALYDNMTSAETILALEEIRQKMMSNQNIPNGSDNNTTTHYTVDEVQKEIEENFQRYKTDSKYRTEMRQKMELAKKDSYFIDKSGG